MEDLAKVDHKVAADNSVVVAYSKVGTIYIDDSCFVLHSLTDSDKKGRLLLIELLVKYMYK